MPAQQPTPHATTFAASLLSHFPPSGTFPPSRPPNPEPLDSFWTRHYTAPLSLSHRNDGSPLPFEVADVVVIGTGLTGVCAVDHLVERYLLDRQPAEFRDKLRIVVLEARDFCSGATARNGGHLTSAPLLSFATLEAQFGTEEAKKCVALEQHSIDWVIETSQREGWTDEIELRIGGGNLHIFDSEEQAKQLRYELAAAERAEQDLSGFEWLTSKQVLERYRATSKAGGILIPGNNVYPLKLVTKLFQRAQTRANRSNCVSLDLFTHCVVSKVERSRTSDGPFTWTVETASRGSIAARHVLHCTNGYLSSVLPQFSTGPSRIYPTRGQVLSIVPPSTPRSSASSWPRFGNAFSAEDPFDIYMFQRSAQHSQGKREIILGGCRDRSSETHHYEFGECFDGEGSLNETVGAAVRKFLSWQFPGVFRASSSSKEKGAREDQGRNEVQVDMEWTGIMGFREGGVPIVGPIFIDGELQDGQWVAAGYSGHGMPRAPASGQLIASLVLDALSEEELLSTSTTSTTTTTTTHRVGFKLPNYFPRHYLTNSSGRPDVEAKVPRESDRPSVEPGWVLV